MHRLAWILLLSSCVADSGDEGFNIVNNLAPEQNCSLSPGGQFLNRGLIDKQSPNPYVLTPEFESRISPADGVADFQRTIALRGANIEVTNAQTGAVVGKFKSLFAASLAPLGSTTAAFDIITPEMLQASGATGSTRVQLVAKVTAFGALGGSGDNIDGVPFEYPVTVCDGCVAKILGACPLPNGTEIGTSSPNSCNPFQDGTIQCCMGPDGPVCPPTVEGAPVSVTVAKTGMNATGTTVTSTPAGISCGTGCTGTFPPGTQVTLSVTGNANDDYSWSLGTCEPGMPCTFVANTTQNITLTAP